MSLAKAIRSTIVIVKRKLTKAPIVADKNVCFANCDAISCIGIDDSLFGPATKVVDVPREHVERTAVRRACDNCKFFMNVDFEPEFVACHSI